MAADGSVVIDTKLDTGGFSSGVNDLRSQFTKMGAAASKAGGTISSVFTGGAKSAKGFGSQLDAVGAMAKKLGGLIAAVFSVQAIVDFSKEALELGSDLQEVQNVVDVTFATMNKRVDEFARNAAQTAGLSETMAKQYTGTFGAMAKSFGFTEEEAFGMSTALTQLSGDVASFYNLTQDVAYTKLKSVFTGETEALKDLGVVMTQTALDDYALRKGFGKTTSEMTEQEKVALRYQFVMEQLNSASGDFIRTQDGWANQTKVLSLQFEQLKAIIGQGLINVLTPVIQKINLLIKELLKAAEAFRSFTESIFGNASETDESVGAIAESTEQLGEAVEEAGKQAKKALAPFDEITKLGNDADDSEESEDIGVDIPSIAPESTELGDVEENANSFVDVLDLLLAKLQEIATWTGLDHLWEGITRGIDRIDFGSIAEQFRAAMDALGPIAEAAIEGAGLVMRSFNAALGDFIGNLITTAGRLIEIGLGGVNQFLAAEGGNIAAWVIETAHLLSTGFDNLTFASNTIFGALWDALDQNEAEIEASIATILSNYWTAFSTIVSGFISAGVEISDGVANFAVENREIITEAFGNVITALLSVAEFISATVAEIATVIAKLAQIVAGGVVGFLENEGPTIIQWVSDTAEKLETGFDNLTYSAELIFGSLWTALDENETEIETTIANVLGALSTMATTIGEILADVWVSVTDGLATFLEENQEDIQTALGNAITDVTEACDVITDAVDDLFTTVKNWWNEDGSVILDDMIQMVKDLGGWVLDIWNNWISPVIDKLIASWRDMWDNHIKPRIDNMLGLITDIGELIKTVWDNVLKPVVDWVVQHLGPVFTSVIGGVIEWFHNLYATVHDVANDLTSALRGVVDFLTAVFAGDWDAAWEAIKDTVESIWEAIKEAIEGAVEGSLIILESAKEAIDNIWTEIKDWVIAAWDKISETLTWDNIATAAENAWKRIRDAFTWSNISQGAKDAWESIKTTFEPVGTFFEELFGGAWERVCDVFGVETTIFTNIKDAVVSGFKELINRLIDGINSIISKPFSDLNNALDGLRNFSLFGSYPFGSIPEISAPSIPYLAQGAVIPPNAPFMAVLGDQRHGTNIEAPLSTIEEAMENVLARRGGMSDSQVIELLQAILEAILGIEIDGETLSNAITNYQRKMAVSTGGNA